MTKKILVVDDDESIREVLSVAFVLEGYIVEGASNGAEAFEYIRAPNSGLELIILDLDMPVMDGCLFLEDLRGMPDKKLSDIPVIIITGRREIDSRTSGHANRVFQKPFDLYKIIRIVEEFLG